MSEQNGTIEEIKVEGTGTEDIKATDFVEPDGKGRKIVRKILGGLALVASAVFGAIIGYAVGNKDDGKGNDVTEPAAETSENTGNE